MKNAFLLFNTILLLILTVSSCQPDDNQNLGIPPREFGPQAIVDDNKINAFFANYTFNDKVFEVDDANDPVKNNGLTHKDIKFIRIIDSSTGEKIELTEEQMQISNGKSILEMGEPLLNKISINFAGVNHTAYFLKIREGQGKIVTSVDPVFVGLESTVFGNGDETFIDRSISLGTPFNQQTQTWLENNEKTRGFAMVSSQFRTAIPIKGEVTETTTREEQLEFCEVFESNPDGTFKTKDNSYGIGVMFLPSALAYYNGDSRIALPLPSGVAPYNNIMFSFTLYNTEYADLDNDGIPSLLEDLNEDNILENDDTDGDGRSNFNDNDDDGDGRATRLEISIDDFDTTVDSDCDGILTNDNDVKFLDTNDNGIDDHLDSSVRVGF